MNKIGRFVSLLLLPLIGIIVYSALKSYFFKTPPSWTFEMSIFIFGSFFMLGAAYCHMLKGHVAVDIINNYLPEKFKKIQGLFSESVILFVALVIIYVSIPNAYRATLMGERSILQTPFNPYVWWFRWVIPISCSLLAWQAVANIYSLLTDRSKNS
ncbi:TRAP transporter small permease subunit [Desulfosediminicola ganghwensis]|uniref:TRAP transporter small permease subunit n=1 Tax=Desulfosediminicola ganghwensis TaxID=2569540 RepID=UPI00142EF205|nr:TRAP transporter small permease [Desulfosediminicola ganghwensis]